jgi:hypothetical protein
MQVRRESMALQDDLKTVETHLEALKDVVDRLTAEAMITPDPTPADAVLDTVVTALKGFGYEITPPVTTTTIPVIDASEGETPLDAGSETDGAQG